MGHARDIRLLGGATAQYTKLYEAGTKINLGANLRWRNHPWNRLSNGRGPIETSCYLATLHYNLILNAESQSAACPWAKRASEALTATINGNAYV